jgi:hypothetical protein
MQAKCEIQKAGIAVYSKNAQSWHLSAKKSAITRFSAGFSGVYFPIGICRVFFVGNDEQCQLPG